MSEQVDGIDRNGWMDLSEYTGRVFDRLAKLDAGEQNRYKYKSQFRWFIKKVEETTE